MVQNFLNDPFGYAVLPRKTNPARKRSPLFMMVTAKNTKRFHGEPTLSVNQRCVSASNESSSEDGGGGEERFLGFGESGAAKDLECYEKSLCAIAPFGSRARTHSVTGREPPKAPVLAPIAMHSGGVPVLSL